MNIEWINNNKQVSKFTFFVLCIILLLSYFWITGYFPNEWGSKLVGKNNSDVSQYLWSLKNFESNFKNGNAINDTKTIFYPFQDMIKSDISFRDFNNLITYLFSYYFENKVLSLNIFLFFQFILSGLGTYLFTKELKFNLFYSFFSVVFFVYSPSRSIHWIEHYNLALTGLIPFIFYFLLLSIDFKDKISIKSYRYFVFAIISFLLLLGSDLVLTYMIILCLSIFLVIFYLTKIKFKITHILAFFILTHFVLEYFFTHGYDKNGGLYWATDLLSYFISPTHLLLHSDFSVYFYNNKISAGFTSESVVFISISLVLLFILSIFQYSKNKQNNQLNFVIFLVIISMILISIPNTKIYAMRTIYNIFSIQHLLPFFNNFRCPARISLILSFALPIWILYNLQKKQNNYFIYLLLFFSCIEILPKQFPNFYVNDQEKLNSFIKNTDVESVMIFPFGVQDGFVKFGKTHNQEMISQLFHGKKISNGSISRFNEKFVHYLKTNTTINNLIKKQQDKSMLNKAEIDSIYIIFKPESMLFYSEYQYLVDSFQHHLKFKNKMEYDQKIFIY